MGGDAYIIDAVRTPVGRKKGSLAGVRADELGAIPLRALIARTGLDPALVEDVVYGCVTQVHEQGMNVGRVAALQATVGLSSGSANWSESSSRYHGVGRGFSSVPPSQSLSTPSHTSTCRLLACGSVSSQSPAVVANPGDPKHATMGMLTSPL